MEPQRSSSRSLEAHLEHNAESTQAPDEGFQTEKVITVAGGHFIHDTYGAFVPPLLPLLQEKLSTSYALTGGLAIYLQLPSLLNPLLGYLADKVSLRYFIILAPALTATLVSIIGVSSSYVLTGLLLFAAGISIAAFHAPAPAMVGRMAGKRIGKGMSFFMASGELGRTFGPIIVIAGVGWFGLEGIWRLAVVGWMTSVLLYFRLRDVSARPSEERGGTLRQLWPHVQRVFPPIIWITLARVFLLVSLTTYLPIYIRDVRQGSLWLAAISLTVFEGAGVAGALIAGTLSDRLGRPLVLLISLLTSPLLLFVFLWAPAGLAAPLLAAMGLAALSGTPVIMALVQEQFPENRALANGLFLAVSFTTRAVATGVVGFLADQFGLRSAFMLSGVVALLGLPAVLKLPGPPVMKLVQDRRRTLN